MTTQEFEEKVAAVLPGVELNMIHLEHGEVKYASGVCDGLDISICPIEEK